MNNQEQREQVEQALARCAKCSDNTDCLKYQDVLFLEAHEDEAKKAVLDAADTIADMMVQLVRRLPIILLVDQDILVSFVKAVFISGYIRGRKFPTVPEVFTRECPDDSNISS